MMTPLLFTAALSLLAADPAQARPPTDVTVSVGGARKADAEPDDPDKIVCRSQAITGSRFIKRICQKRAYWLEQERKTAETTSAFGFRASLSAGMATPGPR